MSDQSPAWLEIHRGDAPLLISFPHTGTGIPDELAGDFVSPWLARRDADWWVHLLYAFAKDLGATLVRTDISRSVIDVNRDPSGNSLYPGQNSTGLCPTITFDNDPLYHPQREPTPDEVARRRSRWFDPYHEALATEIARLRERHPAVVVYDAHSIRSRIPYLFEGELPVFNIGTDCDRSCSPTLTDAVAFECAASLLGHVRNGRFKGGWITRHYAAPDQGIHCIQMELACRGYMEEPASVSPENWPAPWNPEHALVRSTIERVLVSCLEFASTYQEEHHP